MGGAVSELRAEIHRQALLVHHYPTLLEPVLAAVQYFLRTAETGEGADRERTLEDPSMDLVIADKKRMLFEEASTEVELLAENPRVMSALLHAIRAWKSLELSPDIDPLLKWYDPPWQRGERRTRPMPRLLEVPEDEVPRFRTAVLRTSIRCLRLMMLCAEGRERLEVNGGPELLNQAALENPLDDFVKNDVKAIFSAVYGGENAVKRIAISNVPVVVEMMRENHESAIVQLAGVRRMCQLLAGKDSIEPNIVQGETPEPQDQPQQDEGSNLVISQAASKYLPTNQRMPVRDESYDDPERLAVFEHIDAHRAISLAVESLARFDVDKYLGLYVHVSRFVAYVTVKGTQLENHIDAFVAPLTDLYQPERNAKIVGQAGGVEGCIKLLFRARELHREKKAQEKIEAVLRTRDNAKPPDEWKGALTTSKDTTTSSSFLAPPSAPPPPAPLAIDADGNVVAGSGMAALAVVDFTPAEVAQQAIWALDLLARLDFNVSMMKLHKLKYLLEEIRLDPDGKEIGDALIVTRRLRLIRWDEITTPAGSPDSKNDR